MCVVESMSTFEMAGRMGVLHEALQLLTLCCATACLQRSGLREATTAHEVVCRLGVSMRHSAARLRATPHGRASAR